MRHKINDRLVRKTSCGSRIGRLKQQIMRPHEFKGSLHRLRTLATPGVAIALVRGAHITTPGPGSVRQGC